MRKDEAGNACPSTLGEYRELCVAISGDRSRAAKFLDAKIAEDGADSEVIVSDDQMRGLLMPMLVQFDH